MSTFSPTCASSSQTHALRTFDPRDSTCVRCVCPLREMTHIRPPRLAKDAAHIDTHPTKDVASSHHPAPQILRVLKLYYKVASSQLPALQLAPRTKVVLESRQFSPSSSTDTPRSKVVLQSRQFSSSSSPDTPCTKVVLRSRQFPASSCTDCSAY